MSDEDESSAPNLPTVREWLSSWLGIQVPALPAMPQTLKNADKAIGRVLLSLAGNISARVDRSTGKVKAIGKIEIEDIVRNAEDRRKLDNRAAITKAALDEIKEEPGNTDAKEAIDDDWLNTFARIAEDKSSEDLQKLFGKILAGEIRQPGSFSLRTIQFVSTLSREEAQSISEFYSFVMSGDFVPNLDTIGPDISIKILMEELGIASSPTMIGGLSWGVTVPNLHQHLMAGINLGVLIDNYSGAEVKFEIACQSLSRPAKDLYKIAHPPAPSMEFVAKIGEHIYGQLLGRHAASLANNSLRVSVVRLDKLPNGYSANIIYKLPKVVS
jgi:hypothetical protein